MYHVPFRPLLAVVALSLLGGALIGTARAQTETPAKPTEQGTAANADAKPVVHPVATIETNRGKIVLELYPEEAPRTVANFVTLAKKGYYDGLKFHRVVPGYVIQTGDPKGDGTGGPGYTIPDEPNKTLKHSVGALGMAKTAAPDSGGSQFYIVITKPADFLDGRYTVFGKVLQGQSVAEAIVVGDKMVRVTVDESGKAPSDPSAAAPAPVIPARLVRMTPPRLPDVTLKAKDKAALRVRFTVEADGKATAELLDRSGNERVDKAVQEAVARWQWEAARQGGKAVRSDVEMTIELPLKQQR